MQSLSIKLFLLSIVLFINSSNTFAQRSWEDYAGNPLNIHGLPGSWDQSVNAPCVIFNPDSNRFEMWYTSYTGTHPNPGIGFAVSDDGINWTKNPSPVMIPNGGWESLFVGVPCVIRENGTYKMWYTGWNSPTRYPHSIGYATSADGITWAKNAGNPVFTPGQGWESGAVGYPSVIKVPGGYWMFYTGEISKGAALTGRAFSIDGINWQRDLTNNPVLPAGGTGSWDRNNYMARVTAVNDSLYMVYTAESNPGVGGSAIGFAASGDTGKTWLKDINPIITRGAWNSGWIETGGMVYNNYYLYLYYDGGITMARIGTAKALIIPVELISFTAASNDNDVVLNWSTATEINNRGFEIQRSKDDTEYGTIGFVNGYGTTTEQHNYSYSDRGLNSDKYYYRLKQVDYNGNFEYSEIVEVELQGVLSFLLEQNYPNPFNPATTIGFGIQNKSNVKITILNAIGEEVAVLVNEDQDEGFHKVDFKASSLPSGVYFYRLQAGSYVQTRKMILLK